MKTLDALVVSLLAGGLFFSASAGVMEAEAGNDTISVMIANRPALVYRFGNVPFKPYVEKLYTPGGVNVVRDAPHDHLHHHALMFAVGVGEVGFWSERPTDGRQVHRGLLDREAPVAVSERLDWVDAEGKTVLRELREITTHIEGAGDARLLTWRSVLSLPDGAGPTLLTGDHYYGLGMRFLESMDAGGVFLNSAGVLGEIVRGDERLARADWTAFTAEADGAPVTVAMFDHPDNPRYPAWWFTMHTPFAYLSATMNLHREPLEMQPGEPLELTYGVAVWDGRQGGETVEKMRQNWLKLIDKQASER